MYISFDKKKLTALIAMIVLASFLIPLLTESVFARQLDLFAPGTPGGAAAGTATRGSGAVKTFAKTATQGLAGLTGTFATIAMIVIVARSLASTLVTIAANALDMAFKWNTINIFANTVSSGPINLFWGYARDISNAFLILILLWIAFGIIFNLERINARKLLVRVILIGLTINFSLTLTSTIFALSNAIAAPFAKQLDEANKLVNKEGKLVGGGLSIKIMEMTNLQTALNAAGSDAKRLAQQVKNETAAQEAQEISRQATQQGINLTPEQVQEIKSIETFEGPATQHFAVNTVPQVTSEGASVLGTKEAQAVVPFVVAPLAIGAIKLVGGWIAADLVSGFLQQFALGQIDQGAIGWGTNQGIAFMLNPVVGTIFLLVGAFVIGSLAILFIVRGIAIMLLAILSPFAFLSMIIPGQEKYWKMWMGKLLNWSFFAPISFFLLLFTFHFGDVLQRATKADARAVEIQANLPAMFQFIILMGLLISSLWVAKFMGITFASTLMSFGQKYATMGLKAAGGFATGGLKKAYLPMFGQAAATAEKWIGGRSVAAQRFLRIPAAGLRGVSRAGRDTIGQAREKLKKQRKTPEEIQRMITQGAFLTKADEVAAILELAEKKKLAALPGIRGYQEISVASMRSAVDELKRMGGDFMDILKANPSIARIDDFEIPTTRMNQLLAKVNQIPGFQGVGDDNERKRSAMAQMYVMQRMDPGDLAKLNTSIFGDAALANIPGLPADYTRGNLSTELFLASPASARHLAKLMEDDPDAGSGMRDYLNTDRGKQIISLMDAGTYRYLTTSPAARSLGWILPPGYEQYTPLPVLQEELGTIGERIRQLSQTIGNLAPNTRAYNRAIDRMNLSLAEWAGAADRLANRGQPRPSFNNLQINLPPGVLPPQAPPLPPPPPPANP